MVKWLRIGIVYFADMKIPAKILVAVISRKQLVCALLLKGINWLIGWHKGYAGFYLLGQIYANKY
ncbi:hypothetical protein [Mucilaginibacter sp.]|uniref:hypothetical protein n=1 Tax=Mucilaginibacter sp. TaxID=1882438 RepID=UPI00262DADC0|nr:hypothetical protein [Mucilaginibacter sp.]MDB4925068.1 hypothetical protein [Mucilaginibacter sp.]